jgi:uncharacterized ferritin-like protein (DUF455 family)
MTPAPEDMRKRAYAALIEPEAAIKAQLARTLFCAGQNTPSVAKQPVFETSIPGRPERPALVSPRDLKRRSLASVTGRAVLLHALAHIEFNAINLALDAAWRFHDMPDEFVMNWALVASEEALHFQLLCEHLATHGHEYGDFPAHNGLWEMAEKTKNDVLARLALVPRTLEARGLDASPAIREKLKQAGDHRGAEILDIILRDEIGHVAIGNKWFRYCCAERNLDPLKAYWELAARYRAPTLRGPFNIEARLSAGFEQAELDALEQAVSGPKT